MTLIHRANTTAADVIQNISAVRWDNLTAIWGGYSNTTTEPPNWGNALYQTMMMYPDAVGPIAYIAVFAMPFIMMWIVHADMVPAAIVGLFFGLYIMAFVGGTWFWVGILFAAIGIATVLWSLYQRRG